MRGKEDTGMTGETMAPEAAPDGGVEDIVVAAQVAGDHALIVARCTDTGSAIEIYDQLVEMEIELDIEIDGVLVVTADDYGKLQVQQMTDHSTRTGLKWGLIGGAAAALFLPTMITGGAVAMGIVGAAAGKARNRNHRDEVEKELAGVITPGTSGILCLVSATAAKVVTAHMPQAQEVKIVPVDRETAQAVKATAAAAGA